MSKKKFKNENINNIKKHTKIRFIKKHDRLRMNYDIICKAYLRMIFCKEFRYTISIQHFQMLTTHSAISILKLPTHCNTRVQTTNAFIARSSTPIVNIEYSVKYVLAYNEVVNKMHCNT